MQGVCSQKILWKFENLSPIRAFVFPSPNAKPPPLPVIEKTDMNKKNWLKLQLEKQKKNNKFVNLMKRNIKT